MKVKLSFYDRGHKPGDVVEVNKDEFERLMRDGRVAAVLNEQENKEEKPQEQEKLAEAPKNKRGRPPLNKSGE